MNNNDDETQNKNLPVTLPVMEESQILPPPLPIEDQSIDIQESPLTTLEPPIMDTDFPITSEENDSNIPIAEPVLPEEPVDMLSDEDVLKNNEAEELYQEPTELPTPVPLPVSVEELPVEEVATEEIIDSSSPSPINSIKVEITKEKLDDLLTKISEETVNYLMLLTNFLEKKRQFNTDMEKIDKTIEDINKIKDDMIKVLTETEMTSNDFDPSSGAQKSQYAEMILGALALTAAVSGGKRKKTRKHKKISKPSNTKKHNNRKPHNKTKMNKKSTKKSTTKKNKENLSN